MLRLPLLLARRPLARAYSSDPFSSPSVPNTRLDEILDNGASTRWGPDAADAQFPHPPAAPVGSLPPGTAPTPRSIHLLPEERLYHLHVVSSRNNTILTLTNAVGNTCAWVSAGLCGFKNVQRSTYEAGYQCAVRMFDRIAKVHRQSHEPLRLEIAFKGFGFGREALYRALMSTEGDEIRDTVMRLKDTTPIKIGGTKAKKTRRL